MTRTGAVAIRPRTVVAVLVVGVVATALARRARADHGTDAGEQVVLVRPPRALVRAVGPAVRWALSAPGRSGRAGDALLLLHVVGRRTGRTYDVPVGYHRDAGGALVVMTDAPWRVNLRGRPDVEVTLRGTRRPARAELVEDPEEVADAYAALLDPARPRASARRIGLRLARDAVPGHAELAALARREGVCVVRLELPQEAGPVPRSR